MTIREGKWRCPGCREVNRGSQEKCERCGATRDANTKFFLDENDAPVVTDAAEVAKAKAGPDWVCTFCDNSNPAGSAVCTGCNAPKSEKQHSHGAVTPVGAPPPAYGAAQARPFKDTGPAPQGGPPGLPADPTAAAAAPGKAPAKLGIFGAIILMLLLCCCCGTLMLGGSHEATATVASVAWQRSVDVEAIRPVHETAWDSTPPGAYDVSHSREVRDHKKVQRGTHPVTHKEKVQVGSHKEVVGHRDLGNGRFEDVEKDVPDYEMKDVTTDEPTYVEEPVYGERYAFTIDKWTTVRTPEAKGTTDAPRWPELGLKSKEREGAHHEKYTVAFEVEKETKTLETTNEAEFLKLKPGTAWKIKWSGGEVREVVGPADSAGAGQGG